MKSQYRSAAVLGTAIISGLLAAVPTAFAHHFMENATPTSSFDGLMSGLGHPVIGADHLAFVIAIGLIAALRRPSGAVVPVAFVLTTLLGAGIHLAGWTLPLAEATIAGSVVAAGAILFTRAGKAGAAALASFGALAGLFHGYAYGESIIGAETTPLLAYLAGFSLIQLAIGAGAYRAGAWLMNRRPARFAQLVRLGGTAMSVLGLGLLAGTSG